MIYLKENKGYKAECTAYTYTGEKNLNDINQNVSSYIVLVPTFYNSSPRITDFGSKEIGFEFWPLFVSSMTFAKFLNLYTSVSSS